MVVEVIIRVSHEDLPILRVVIRCDVMVAVNGEAPHIFMIIIEVNVGVKIIMAPLKWRLFVDLISIIVIFIIGILRICREGGVIQYSWR